MASHSNYFPSKCSYNLFFTTHFPRDIYVQLGEQKKPKVYSIFPFFFNSSLFTKFLDASFILIHFWLSAILGILIICGYMHDSFSHPLFYGAKNYLKLSL